MGTQTEDLEEKKVRVPASQDIVDALLSQMQDRMAVTYQPEQVITMDNVNRECLGRYSSIRGLAVLNPFNYLPSRVEADRKESLERRNADEARIKAERSQVRMNAMESTEKTLRQVQEQAVKHMQRIVNQNSNEALQKLQDMPNPPK